MDKTKLISLSKRLGSSSSSNDTPYRAYIYLSENKVIPVFDILNAEEIALLCFMIPMVSSSNNLNILYDEVLSKMFSFTICEITDTEPFNECSRCTGEGSIECRTCDGYTEVDCDYCGGSGEGDDGEPCDECQGGGQVGCSDCGQSGRDDCDKCDGSGEILDEDNYEVVVTKYLSWDENIFNSLEMIDDMSEISVDLSEIIEGSSKTFVMNKNFETSDVFYGNAENGDTYFISLNKEIYLTKMANSKQITDSNLDSI